MIVAKAAGTTDPGRKRRRNEDSYVLDPPLFAVADGMGGAQAGEVASQLAAAALREGGGGNGGDAQERVVALIQEANRRVWQRANEDASASGMGTTVTAALVEPDGRVLFGHVGDSRAYILRGESFEQLTDDHSLVAELVRRGELSPQEAESHPQRSVITRALGTDPDVDVDTFEVKAIAGDVFLICSDGLSTMVDDETMRRTLADNRGDLDAASKALVAAANRGGGEDNITAVLFQVDEDHAADGATIPLAALPSTDEPPAHDPDEDTLEGVPVPAAVDTMVVSPEDAAQLLAPVEPPVPAPSLGRRLLVLLVILTLVLVIAALVLWGLAR